MPAGPTERRRGRRPTMCPVEPLHLGDFGGRCCASGLPPARSPVATLTMLDLDAKSGLRRLFLATRARVSVGFLVAVVAIWLARPSLCSLAWGTSITAVGEAVRVWAAGHLRKGQEVTSSGPHRHVAHPLYVGSCVLGLGFAVAVGHPLGAGLVVVYLAITLFAAVPLEEATLSEAFGAEFDWYTRGEATPPDRRFSVE